jgi:hypothetical protein
MIKLIFFFKSLLRFTMIYEIMNNIYATVDGGAIVVNR